MKIYRVKFFVVFVLVIFFFSCERDIEKNMINEIHSHMNDYKQLKNIIINNYDTINKQIVRFNDYTRIVVLNDNQIYSLSSKQLSASIINLKKHLDVRYITLMDDTDKSVLFGIKYLNYTFKSENYYLIFTPNNQAKIIINNSYHFDYQNDIELNWTIAKQTTSLAD